MATGYRFVRLAETDRAEIAIHYGGRALPALVGDTVLTALLVNGVILRRNEFAGDARAGLCNMGACQDCWVMFEDGTRARACTTDAADGMRIRASEGGP